MKLSDKINIAKEISHSSKKTNLACRISPELKEQLLVRAKGLNISFNDLVRLILLDYMEKEND